MLHLQCSHWGRNTSFFYISMVCELWQSIPCEKKNDMGLWYFAHLICRQGLILLYKGMLCSVCTVSPYFLLYFCDLGISYAFPACAANIENCSEIRMVWKKLSLWVAENLNHWDLSLFMDSVYSCQNIATCSVKLSPHFMMFSVILNCAANRDLQRL